MSSGLVGTQPSTRNRNSYWWSSSGGEQQIKGDERQQAAVRKTSHSVALAFAAFGIDSRDNFTK